jgi:hypothetical protein
VVPEDKGVLQGLYRGWKLRLDPRIGFAWDVTGNGDTSVRGAWGIFHASINEEVTAIQTNNEPFLVSFSTTPPNTENPWAGQRDPLPYDPKKPSFGPFPRYNAILPRPKLQAGGYSTVQSQCSAPIWAEYFLRSCVRGDGVAPSL